MTYAAQEPYAVRIGRLLSIVDASDLSDAALAVRVGDGLSVEAADGLFGGVMPGSSFGNVISESTLRRARKGSGMLSREHSERLYEMSRVIDAALRAYRGDRVRANAFLALPHPMLDGQTPLALAQTSSAGADAVVALIERALAGLSA
jgi:putative toxin-antitoxin system antitoxin component (TIGR02293 family)